MFVLVQGKHKLNFASIKSFLLFNVTANYALKNISTYYVNMFR